MNISLKEFRIGRANILMPSDHALPGYQATFPLYDRFLPFLVANTDNADWMIDVGANVGDTLFSILNQKPTAKVLAIEADQVFYELMGINVTNNQKLFPSAQVDILSCLVGTGNFKGTLSGQFGTKNLVVSNNNGLIDDNFLSLDTIVQSKDITLKNIKIIKVDTDGFDFDVILSGQNFIAEYQPIIYFENQFFDENQRQGYSKMYQRLRELGYTKFYLFDNFGALILETSSVETIESINEYLRLQNNGKTARTFHYCDILCTSDSNIIICDRSIADYQNWIENYQQLTVTNTTQSEADRIHLVSLANRQAAPTVVVDGVFFQLYNTGIARVWTSLLEEWANTEFGNHLVVLDRAETAPKVEGISYCHIPAYDYKDTDADRAMLQQVCNDLNAELFISTYYTTPLETPSIFMGYDMIPEVLGFDLHQPMWQEKQYAIEHASAYLTISEHTAQDLVEIYPNINSKTVTVAHCGTHPVFKIPSTESIDIFRNKYGIKKSYFILIGSSLGGYKNGILFWQGFSQLDNAAEFDLICTGAAGSNAEELKQYAPHSNIHHLRLDDHELNLAYAGATALVYPSKYEGFGLPIIEAFASGCPVITCPNASIPEVAGEAVIYVFDDDIEGMTEALCEVQKPQVRAALIDAGLDQVKQFSWTKMSDIIKSVLITQTLTHLPLGKDNLIIFPDWLQNEEALGEELTTICYNLSQSSEFNRPTLLIDTTNSEDVEAANMLISGVAMNLMMSADIDITEHLEMSLVNTLAQSQWQSLLPKLNGRIKLELENAVAIKISGADSISEIQLTKTPTLAFLSC